MGEKKERGLRTRLSGEKRDRCLEVLSQTGNRGFAAEAIGVDPRLMDQRREFDPALDRAWEEALDQADRRLAGASGPLDTSGMNVIKRGRGGRLQIVKAGPKRWSRPVEERFFAALAACGTIRAAARAVGFSTNCIDQRRKKWPDFAARMEEALEAAELEIEFRLATCSNPPETERGRGGETGGDAEPGKFDPDLAMRFLKWREEKRRGRERSEGRDSWTQPRTLEEVQDSILRKLSALARHRARQSGGGDTRGSGTGGQAG
ncbi:MAG TPA: hypothetical protein VGB59_06695 [Allosphingosinicella sp.]